MGGFSFNPSDIQSVGIGLAAFLATILTLFVYLSAGRERLGRAMWIALAAAAMWAWFGFLYHVVSDLTLARGMRVMSVIGIVFLTMSELNFAATYLAERVPLKRWVTIIKRVVYGGGAVLTGILIADLAGSRYIVGDLLKPTDMVLAPNAGPLLGVLIAYYAVSVFTSGVLLALRVRASQTETERRQSILLFASMTLGLTLGGLRFTPWYGFDFYPIVGDLGFPLFAFAALYSITRYGLLSLQVVAAQFLIFILWAFTFFRILLEPTLAAAVPDIMLFGASIILGVLLLRSAIAEIRSEKELAKLTIDRARSEFITIAAHQLRTPASALRWTFNLLQEDKTLTDAQRATVSLGGRAADNMANLINDLLDVGKISDGKFRYSFDKASVSDILDDAVRSLESRSASAHVAVELRHANDLPDIICDKSKLSMVFQNLIENAVKYTPAGGHVIIETTRDAGGVRVSITDTGVGFTEEEKKHVFEKFFRGARAMHISPDGSGLGLVIAKTIVDAHGGTITLTSAEDKGATFTVSLPTGEAHS